MTLAVPGRARERVASALALAACLAVGMAPGLAVNTRAQQVSAADLHVLPVRGNVYMLVGAGANITLSVGGEGTLLVDAGPAASADAVVAAVQQLARQVTSSPMPIKPCAGLGCVGVAYPSYLGTIASPAPPRPIQFIVNTNGDADHVGGNARIAQAGTTIGGGPGWAPSWASSRRARPSTRMRTCSREWPRPRCRRPRCRPKASRAT
jgi:glyoxylase-like metal-dependent hydrolase (beta-lactamase superfamily II)